MDALSSLSLIVLMVSVDIKQHLKKKKWNLLPLAISLAPALEPFQDTLCHNLQPAPPLHEHLDHVSSCNIMYITCLIYFIVLLPPKALVNTHYSMTCNVLTEPCHCVKDRKNLRRRTLMTVKKL